jgi:uncharacterized protein (TIGR02246 family)
MIKQQLEDSPAGVIERFTALLNERDVDGALELYEEDAAFAVRPGEVVHGRDQIHQALNEYVALKPKLSGRIIKVLETTDHAVVFNEWSLKGIAPDGSDVEMGATSADVLHRDEYGRWRVLIDDPWGT